MPQYLNPKDLKRVVDAYYADPSIPNRQAVYSLVHLVCQHYCGAIVKYVPPFASIEDCISAVSCNVMEKFIDGRIRFDPKRSYFPFLTSVVYRQTLTWISYLRHEKEFESEGIAEMSLEACIDPYKPYDEEMITSEEADMLKDDSFIYVHHSSILDGKKYTRLMKISTQDEEFYNSRSWGWVRQRKSIYLHHKNKPFQRLLLNPKPNECIVFLNGIIFSADSWNFGAALSLDLNWLTNLNYT